MSNCPNCREPEATGGDMWICGTFDPDYPTLACENFRLKRELKQARLELDRLSTWKGLMSLLDKHYPADIAVLSGESGGPGPRLIAAVRRIDELQVGLAQANAVLDAIETLTEKRSTAVTIAQAAAGRVEVYLRNREWTCFLYGDTLCEALEACVKARDQFDNERKV